MSDIFVDDIFGQIDDSLISKAYLGGFVDSYCPLDSTYVLNGSKQGFLEKRNFERTYLVDKARVVSRRFRDDVQLFIRRICASKSDIDFSFLSKNLGSLRIRVKPKFIYYFCLDRSSRASYTVENNTISLLRVDAKKNIFHELFHMASSYDGQDGFYFSGFRQYRLFGFSVGLGLNEGYTQLLTERYFSDLAVSETYPLEVEIARGLEQIIGREKMESLYFKADLYRLREECKQYYGVDSQFEQFLSDLDWVCLHETEILKGENKEGFGYLQRINNYLACLFLGKQQFLLRNHSISHADYHKNINQCLQDVDIMNYTINGDPYCWCCDKEELVKNLRKMGIPSVNFSLDFGKDDEVGEMLSEKNEISSDKKSKR